jgi:hypothetical protein
LGKAALLATAAGSEDREEASVQYLLKFLGSKYNDAFVHVAAELGYC